MNKFLTALLLCSGLASCQSCSKVQAVEPAPIPTNSVEIPLVPDAPKPPLTTIQVIQGDDFRFTLSPDWQNQGDDSNHIKASYFNNSLGALVQLTVQDFTSSYQELILVFVRSLKDSGIEVSNSLPMTINGHEYTYLLTKKDGLLAHVWVTVYNNKAYQFTCGAEVMPVQETCQSIVNSLELK